MGDEQILVVKSSSPKIEFMSHFTDLQPQMYTKKLANLSNTMEEPTLTQPN